ncbi:MAG: glycine cleavage system aminomethyltransferase GcvT [Epsilonproteobacteria bacterium]|nr:glycine cleavage system aminomethyltransferase GcvT [Campylobacterota bacterium]
MQNLYKTSLKNEHEKLKAKSVSFCGWDMPLQYESIIKEHDACRNDAALFDISHMGELFFKGDIEKSGVDKSVTQDLIKLPVGRCKYGFLLNEKGGIIDDLIIYKIAEDELMFVVNAARREIDYKTIKSRIKSGELTDRTFEISKIDIQGPRSKEILQKFVDIDLDELKYFSFKYGNFEDDKILISRTGYTGELGYELYMDNDLAPKVWEKLLQSGATPAGLGARDLLRLEMGYSLYGNELNEDITPLEANLGMFIKFDTDFVGKDVLKKQKDEGVKRLILPFKTSSRRAPRHGDGIFQGDKKVGVVTSGAYSPSLGYGIGLGLFDLNEFDKEKEIEVRDKRGSIKIELDKLPFIKK